jgi:hypothetical protein
MPPLPKLWIYLFIQRLLSPVVCGGLVAKVAAGGRIQIAGQRIRESYREAAPTVESFRVAGREIAGENHQGSSRAGAKEVLMSPATCHPTLLQEKYARVT